MLWLKTQDFLKNIERRDDCADVYGRVITLDEFIKKYKPGLSIKPITNRSNKESATALFCDFYRNQPNR